MPANQARARTKEAKQDFYRTVVIAAAERAFADHGYEGVKMQEIADASGISLGTLYAVFQGKWEVFRAIHAARLKQLFAAISDRQVEPLSPGARLLEGARATVRWLAEHPDYLRMQLIEGHDWSTDISFASEEQEAGWAMGRELLQDAVVAAIDAGDVYEEDPSFLVRLIPSMYRALLSLWIEEGMKEDVESLLDRLETQLLRAVFKRTPNDYR